MNYIKVINSGSIMYDIEALKYEYEVSYEGNVTNKVFIEPLNEKLRKSNKIAKRYVSNDDYNLAITFNGEYAYYSNKTHKLMKDRYHYATPFNEYGFAMVAKDGCALWVDKKFRYLSLEGDFKYQKEFIPYDSFQEISEFSKGEHPLSRVSYPTKSGMVSEYLATDGKLKQFRLASSNKLYNSNVTALYGSDFKDKDYIITNEGIFFSDGYYCLISFILDLVNQDNLANEIHENIVLKRKKK